MAERRFTRVLSKPGSAAQVRETVSQAVRESTVQAKPRLVEPLDYESYVIKNQTILHNDPQREMLLYPADDVSQEVLPKRYRTAKPTVPGVALQEAKDLFVQECIRTYTSNFNVVHYKYSAYAGSYLQLPKVPKADGLEDQVYEVDTMLDERADEITRAGSQITKQGYLLKGPDTGHDSFIASIATKSFKRRFVFLRQVGDGSYMLEFFKDDKKNDPKFAISMELCSEVVRNSKRGKYSFELRMQSGQKSYVLSAENEPELDDWLAKINTVIQSSKQEEINRRLVPDAREGSPPMTPENRGTLKSLEHSRNPELMKYAKESDYSIAAARKESRQKVFSIYPEMPRTPEPTVEPDEPNVNVYRDRFGTRFAVRCESLRFRLFVPVESDRGSQTQLEPYFTTMALYDAKNGKKLSEDFKFDLNRCHVRNLLPKGQQQKRKSEAHQANGALSSEGPNGSVSTNGHDKEKGELSEEWLAYPKQAVFNVSHPDPEIYLVVRIEKVLQGSISQAAEMYSKAGDARVSNKLQKVIRSCCQRLGQYRMPFAWTARPVFRSAQGELDTASEFGAIYRQDGCKLSDEDLVKHLADLKKPDKVNRLGVIPGSIKVVVEKCDNAPISNSLTPSLVPVRPFPYPPNADPTFEVEEFPSECASDGYPFVSYTNNFYVFPKSLKYDTQKHFTKARNIACVIEFRDSDEEGAQPLKCIRGNPGEPIFTTQARCAVVHHNTCPDFYEEVKIALPVQLHDRHHVLFTFLHVSCEPPKGAKRKDQAVEMPVGYAWMPILRKGRPTTEETVLPVASHLPAGYSTCEPLGLGKGYSGPEIRWVEGQKPLFRVDFKLVSTVYTKDQHLHNFFSHAQKLVDFKVPANDVETCKNLKVLHAVDVYTLVSFLPTILNQLFSLLVRTVSEDIALNTVRVLVHIVNQVHEAKKMDILHTYIKYVFVTEPTDATRKTTVHEELTKSLTMMLRPANTDFLVVNKFLKHAWFFFQIIIKSMAQHLITANKIKMHRHERFQSEYQFRVQNLLQSLAPHITQKFQENPTETRMANRSLAFFIKKCLNFMDRGFAFKLVNFYVDKFNVGDPKVLQEYKFEFLQIIVSHEHYVSLNLPLLRRGPTTGHTRNMKEGIGGSGPDFEHEYRLSEEFCRNHFLVGVLLQEVRSALCEVRDVRKIAVGVLRNQLAKHGFDDRYQSKAQQARIASLYLPFMTIVLENLNRLDYQPGLQVPVAANHGDTVSNDSLCGSSSRNSGTWPHSNSVNSHSTPSSVGSAPLAAIATPLNSQRLTAYRFPSETSSQSDRTPTRHQRDSTYLSMIAGQLDVSQGSGGDGSDGSTQSSSSTLSAKSTNNSQVDLADAKLVSDQTKCHSRSQSMPFCGQNTVRYDKLDKSEVTDLLLCFLYVVKNVNEELLIGWWQQCSEYDLLDFFHVIEICLHNFKYLGKKLIADKAKRNAAAPPKALTLPARMAPPHFSTTGRTLSSGNEASRGAADPSVEPDSLYRALLEANMATEVGLIALDVLGIYCVHFKGQLVQYDGDNATMRRVFDIYVSFLQVGQSEKLLCHVFAALRSFINKFQKALFLGNGSLCGRLCYEILKCCNSRLSTTRNEACALLYLLMRSNYEFTERKGLTRVHLQVIISVSQLLGEVTGINNSRFQESLSSINNYANTDKAMHATTFPNEVKDLTKRIRTVLMATAQMREHENDPEMLIDLQHSLANSYAATPELRKTWLESMAKNHQKNGDFTEAAHCYIHIAALVAQYLRQKGVFQQGCEAFKPISANIVRDETSIKQDSGVHDVHYTEEILVELLEHCAVAVQQAERYEVVGHIYKLILPYYEERKDYEALAACYEVLHNACAKANAVRNSGKRLLGKYYRVAFFGQSFFDDDAGKEYIYKEPKVTSLPEISERLYHLFCEKFGKENVKMIMDSVRVESKDLDPKFAYVQVTHVTPYFDDFDAEERICEFERNNNIRRFVFETPFVLDGKKAHGSIEEQWKKKTILTTIYSFPYVKKRIAVFSKQVVDLSPLEVAIDEMRTRTAELNEVIDAVPTDLVKLQLKLQGSISVQVNAGPLAYAYTFLDEKKQAQHPKDKTKALKDVYRQFVKACNKALILDGRLVTPDLYDFHDNLKRSFNELVNALSELTHEKFLFDARGSFVSRNSSAQMSLNNAPSGSSLA